MKAAVVVMFGLALIAGGAWMAWRALDAPAVAPEPSGRVWQLFDRTLAGDRPDDDARVSFSGPKDVLLVSLAVIERPIPLEPLTLHVGVGNGGTLAFTDCAPVPIEPGLTAYRIPVRSLFRSAAVRVAGRGARVRIDAVMALKGRDTLGAVPLDVTAPDGSVKLKLTSEGQSWSCVNESAPARWSGGMGIDWLIRGGSPSRLIQQLAGTAAGAFIDGEGVDRLLERWYPPRVLERFAEPVSGYAALLFEGGGTALVRAVAHPGGANFIAVGNVDALAKVATRLRAGASPGDPDTEVIAVRLNGGDQPDKALRELGPFLQNVVLPAFRKH